MVPNPIRPQLAKKRIASSDAQQFPEVQTRSAELVNSRLGAERPMGDIRAKMASLKGDGVDDTIGFTLGIR